VALVSKSPTIGSINYVIDQISHSEVGSHNLLIHPNMDVLRYIYSGYVKRHLKDGNEIVLILPYYETEDKVREVLTLPDNIVDAVTADVGRRGNDDNTMNIGINKYEKEGSLIIKDSVKAYFSDPHDNSNNNAWNLIHELVKRAKNSTKNSVSVIADLGSFYHHLGNTQRLVDYELSLPSRYNDMKMKGLCVYHKEDFEKRFTEEQKQKLLQHHEQVFIVEDR
jgi:MEDS: MEthanogen/methylotroph, DcmR Sensory domain